MDANRSFFLKQFKYHTKKLASLNCHILFLSACLSFGITPHGLRPKFPIQALPPSLHKHVEVLSTRTSFELTNLVLQLYKDLFRQHKADSIKIQQEALSKFPNIYNDFSTILLDASKFMSSKSQNLLKKLSALCRETLNKGESLPTCYREKYYPDNDNPSLFLNPPSSVETAKKTMNKSPGQNNYDNMSHRTIENLSSYTPNQHEISVLNKGLTFSPTPKFNQMNLVADCLAFARDVRIKFFFSRQQNSSSNSQNLHNSLKKFKPCSEWEPPILPPDHPVEQFINTISSTLSNPAFEDSLPKQQNLTFKERKAITSLKNNNKIMVLPSDKGNSVVILNKEDYIREAERQLNDKDTYQPLPTDPTNNFNTEISDFIKLHGPSENVSDIEIDLLTPKIPQTPVFYILPKTHKPTRPPPGRPIVSSCDSPTERISSFVDEHLQPFTKSLPSHIKDSDHLIERLSEIPQPLNSNIILATVDVESLYTNIPHTEGIKSAEHYLNLRNSNDKPSTKFLTSLIHMILTMNSFRFQNKYYLQLKGTAMGTRMAPSYANLFMGSIETSFLNSEALKPLGWFRFIDDILIIWQHGINNLNLFLKNLNSFSNLNFTWNISDKTVTFLDIDIFLENGNLKTKIHVKENNPMQYLHYSSCHPNYIKKSIPTSLAVRAKKLCSNKSDYNNYIGKIKNAFSNRGYPNKIVNSQINKPKNTNKPNIKNQAKFVTTFFPGSYKINGIIKTAYNLLDSSPLTRNLFNGPPRVIFKKPPNIKNLIVKPKLPYDEPNQSNKNQLQFGCQPCLKPRCKTCKIITPSKSFTSQTTKRSYPITGKMNCHSSNVVYQLSCNKCPKDYIGQTITPLHIRMNKNRSDTNLKVNTNPLSAHAMEHQINFDQCFSLKCVNQIQIPNRLKLNNLEVAHQKVLRTKFPDGLNLRFG